MNENVKNRNGGNKFLGLDEYEETKDKFIDLMLSFDEHITAKRRYLVTKGGQRIYQSLGEDEFVLNNSELLLIAQASNEAKKNSTHYPTPYNRNKSHYMSVSDNLLSKRLYKDIYQIDINAAYVKAALNRKYISQNTYNKFFEIELDKEQIETKKNSPDYHSGGKILRYSKKCRLVAMGVLAQRKTVIKTKFSKAGQTVESEERYNEKYANIFFTCAHDVDICLFDCMNVKGSFFYWVDAIFCTKEAVEEIVKKIQKHGFECKIKKHSNLYRYRNIVRVWQNDDEDYKEYPFPSVKQRHFQKFSNDIEDRFESILEDYEIVKTLYTEKEAIERFAKYIKVSVQRMEFFLEQSGYNIFNYILFNDLCELLDIDSIKDFNLDYLIKRLEKKGFTLKDYLRICNLTVSHITYENHDCIKKTVAFFSAKANVKRTKLKIDASVFGELYEEMTDIEALPTVQIVRDGTEFLDNF